MHANRRTLLRNAGALLLSASAFGHAAAQQFPSKPLKILVPNPPGGPTDVVARLFAERLSQSLGQPVVVEYKPGGNGAVVANATIAAPADGHTIALSTIGGQVLTPAINTYLKQKQEPDVLNQLIPVSHIADVILVMVASTQSGFQTLPELVAYAKANPGKLNFASTGVGASDHLGLEMFNKAVGISTVHIPQKGFAGALASTLGGDTQYWMASLNQQIVDFHKAGKLHILAVTSPQRARLVPDVPTAAEAANIPGFEVGSWQALFVRAGTDKAIVARLSSEIQRAARDPELVARMNAIGMITTGTTPEVLQTRVAAEYRKWTDMLQNTRIAVN